jgi:two-component system CheB/CheR fusion protein
MARVDILEQELAATRESLQATVEELETSNEELQATNEELMASNEELQSSNEELQSVNEELNTVNAEFQEKVSILNRLNIDLDSMTKAVGVATVFVDEGLHLNRFSPDAAGILKLREGDLGRPLDEINHILEYSELMEDLANTMRSERLVEKEVAASDGRIFLVRILPYGVPSSSHRGAVATFVDVTSLRDKERLQSIIDALPEHIAVLTPDGTIAMVNNAWIRFAQANGDPGLAFSGPGANYLDACLIEEGKQGMGAEEAQQAHMARLGIKSVLEGSQTSFSLQYPCHSQEEERWFVMNAAPILGSEFGAVVSHINITTWHQQHNAGLTSMIATKPPGR